MSDVILGNGERYDVVKRFYIDSLIKTRESLENLGNKKAINLAIVKNEVDKNFVFKIEKLGSEVLMAPTIPNNIDDKLYPRLFGEDYLKRTNGKRKFSDFEKKIFKYYNGKIKVFKRKLLEISKAVVKKYPECLISNEYYNRLVPKDRWLELGGELTIGRVLYTVLFDGNDKKDVIRNLTMSELKHISFNLSEFSYEEREELKNHLMQTVRSIDDKSAKDRMTKAEQLRMLEICGFWVMQLESSNQMQ